MQRKREREGRGFRTVNISKKKIVFYATENQVSLVSTTNGQTSQEHDKIKKHKFTSDAHLAHYFFFLS